jgi:TRAP-type C4-dicarboxylate transport system substrate-binding protein
VRAHGVTLKIHHFLPADSVFHNQFLLPWKEKLEKESNGYLRIQIYPAMQMGGNPSQLYDQVKNRTADIVWTSIGPEAGRFPAFEVFNLPLMTNSAKGSNRALWEYIQMHNLARKEFAGVRLLAVHVSRVGPGDKAQAIPEDDLNSPLLASEMFIFAMNAEAYKSLSDEIKKVLGANSGAETSAWLGKILEDGQASAGKLADGEGGALAADRALWQQRAQRTIENRIHELDQRGLDGKELVESARALLAEYDPPN